LSTSSIGPGDNVTVTLDVNAVGPRLVTDVVQVYVAALDPPVERPPKELAAWRKLTLAPGQSATVAIELGPHAFRRWDEDRGDWTIDPGNYEVVIAASATDVRQRLALRIA
jgi:beta-glucosidase